MRTRRHCSFNVCTLFEPGQIRCIFSTNFGQQYKRRFVNKQIRWSIPCYAHKPNLRTVEIRQCHQLNITYWIVTEFLLVDPTRASDTGYFRLSCLETLHYPWDLWVQVPVVSIQSSLLFWPLISWDTLYTEPRIRARIRARNTGDPKWDVYNIETS